MKRDGDQRDETKLNIMIMFSFIRRPLEQYHRVDCSYYSHMPRSNQFCRCYILIQKQNIVYYAVQKMECFKFSF